MPLSSRQESFSCTLAGNNVQVNVDVELPSFIVNANFWFMGHPYLFRVTKWAGPGQATFTLRFHEVPRNEQRYGVISDDGTATKTTDQKVNSVLQAVKDVFSCLNTIIETHQRSVLDYAVYFREKVRRLKTYGDYITLITCHNIVHQDFYFLKEKFNIVRFDPTAP